MATVALVGGDGAGKTTIGKRLERSFLCPVKYLYMGMSTRSSEHALLTSRLALFLKQRSYKKRMLRSGIAVTESIPARDLEYGQTDRGQVWAVLRFLNRLVEAWYRQLISLSYQLSGYIVIYDRHYLFDSAPPVDSSGKQKRPRLDALYHWIMVHTYPRPTLTIMLDAPPEVLYGRKREATPQYLSEQRQAFIQQGSKEKSFVRIDATQPIDRVFDEVVQHIRLLCASKVRIHSRTARQARIRRG